MTTTASEAERAAPKPTVVDVKTITTAGDRIAEVLAGIEGRDQ